MGTQVIVAPSDLSRLPNCWIDECQRVAVGPSGSGTKLGWGSASRRDIQICHHAHLRAPRTRLAGHDLPPSRPAHLICHACSN